MLENSHMTQTNQEIAGSERFFRSLLEPGKYVLTAAHADYMDGLGTDLRITRENLTNVSPIYLVRKGEQRILICQ